MLQKALISKINYPSPEFSYKIKVFIEFIFAVVGWKKLNKKFHTR